MDTNQNNSQINTFLKGMDTDTSVQMMQSDQYTMAKNLRVFPLNSGGGNQFGQLKSIEGVTKITEFDFGIGPFRILAADTIRNYGVLILESTTEGEEYKWYIYRLDYDGESFSNPVLIFANDGENADKEYRLGGDEGVEKLSIVCRYEDENNVKVYIADGVHSMLIVNILNKTEYEDISQIESFKSITLNPLIFSRLTTGNLSAGMVQYSYSLYSKKGSQSEASVPTKLIPIVKNANYNQTEGKEIEGDDEGKQVGAGVVLKLPVIETELFDKIKVYRIFYTQNGQQPTIETIVDTNIEYIDYISDTGQHALETLTIEEYNSLAGIHIIPKVLESKFDYLFAANIKDTQTSMDLYTKTFDARSYSQEPSKMYSTAFYDVNTKEPLEQQFDFGHYYGSDGILISEGESGVDENIFDVIESDWDCFNIYNDMSQGYTDFTKRHDSGYSVGKYCRYNARDKNNIVYGGIGKYIDWKFVVTEIDMDKEGLYGVVDFMDDHCVVDNPFINLEDKATRLSSKMRMGYIGVDGNFKTFDTDMSNVYENNKTYGINYSNPAVSYAYKSLRRDELYRFGIILYNKRGEHSSVKWIADIRTPHPKFKGCEPFMECENVYQTTNYEYTLKARPLGIQFIVDIEKYNRFLKENSDSIENWSEDLLIEKYEIVRCNRTENDICTLSQGVLARPVKKIINRNATKEDIQDFPYTPTGLLTTQNIWHGGRWSAYNYSITDSERDDKEASNYENHTLYQFVSPEIVYQKDSIEDLLNNKDVYITPINYLFNQQRSFNQSAYWCPPNTKYGHDNNHGQYVAFKVTNDEAMHRWGINRYGTFMQIGTNLSMGMPIPTYRLPLLKDEYNSYLPIGKQEDANYVDGIQFKSIFHLRNYVVCQYYSVFPKYHWFSDSRTAVTGNNWQQDLSYCPIDGTVPLLWKDLKKNNLKVTTRQIGYSKLYKQSPNIYLRHYSIDSDYTNIVGSKTVYDTVDLSNSTQKYNINNFKVASEIGWNEMFEESQGENNKTTVNWKASDTLDVIGNSNYCNCVLWGIIDDADAISQLTENSGEGKGLLSEGYPIDVCIGPGGRTGLIEIDDDSILYKAIAVSEYQYGKYEFQEDGILQNTSTLSAETYCNDPAIKNDEFNDYISPKSQTTHFQKYDMIYVGKESPYNVVIYRNSVGGTFLCNIRQNIVPYGGYDYSSRSLNTYYSYGDLFKPEGNGIVFDGDCYINVMEYVAQHKWWYSKISFPSNTCNVFAIPVESNINLAYTYGNEVSRNRTEYVGNVQIEPSSVYNYYAQTKPLYNYNTVYSVNPSAKLYAATDLESDIDLQNTDYRCYYSNPKTNDENVDSWSKFMPINYLDVDSRYGEITNLVSFKDKLMFWQDRAVGQLSVNERAQVLDENNQSLILGSGGVLSRYDYIDQITGMSKEKYADTQSTSVLYWYDDKNKELKSYGNRGYENMNDTYHTDNLMWDYATSKNPILFYDNKYSEMVSKVLDDNSLAYNEKYGMFTSVYEVPFDGHIQFSNDHYLLTNKEGKLGIHKWNTLTNDRAVDTQGNVLQTYVQYVINQAPLTTKTFDNQEIVTSELPGYKSFDKNYFSTNHTYTWETDLNYSETNDLEYTDREGNFRYAIPRALDEEGNQVPYGNRMRGKYMICSITDKENKYDTSISYIITKFRQSWT